MLLVDGEIRGTWRPKRSRGKLTLTVEPFAKLTAAHRERLVAAAETPRRFRGATSVTVDIGST